MIIHKFETAHMEHLEFAATGRIPYSEILRQRDELLTPALQAVTEAAPTPMIFFNEAMQVIHANRAALDTVGESCVENVIGLRMGEFLGSQHSMGGPACKNPDECQNCNAMGAIREALDGRAGKHDLQLVMHPDSAARRLYQISASPVPVADACVAMVVLEETCALS